LRYWHLGGGGLEAGEEGIANLGYMFDDAAGPSYREFTGNLMFAAELRADQQDKFDEIGRGLGKSFPGDRVTGLG
jgi:hypothetical protein